MNKLFESDNPVRITLRVLTENEELRLTLEAQLNGLGYEPIFAANADDLKRSIPPTEPYYMLVDYQLSDGANRALLLELLELRAAPSGLLVISDLPGFEEFMQEVAECYADQSIPFFFLEKPFERGEVGELLLRLKEKFQSKIYGCMRLPKHSYVSVGHLGGILREARENLGLSYADVILAADKTGLFLSEDRLKEIEADEEGATLSANEWMDLSRLLYEFPDNYNVGFEPWCHLRRVRNALEEKTYHFPMNFVLRRKLVELARRERLEHQYSDLVVHGSSRN